MSRRLMLLALVLLGILGCAVVAVAQYPNCGFNCTAGDVTVVGARVEVPGNTCVIGEDVTASIYATFKNGTKSTRYAVRVLGDLYVDGVVVTSLDACVAESIGPGTSEYLLMTETIPCSARVEFRLVVVSWSASAESCADTPGCADRKAKCWSPSGGTIVISVPALVVGFTSNTPVCLGGPIRFTNMTTGGKTPYQSQWQFGDGATSTAANPTHTYATAGEYTVSLAVRDATGVTSTALGDVIVLEPPLATADNGGPYCPGQTVALYADGGVSYKWTGPSGFASTQQNPTIPRAGAANAGTYTVTVTDAYGCSSQATTLVVLDATPPTLSIPSDATVECDEAYDPSVTGEATAFDNEDPAPTVTHTDLVTSGACGGAKRVQRTWTAVDECGNRSSGVQIVDLVDTTPPVLTVSGATFECDGSGNASDVAAWLASAKATDACGSATITNDYVEVTETCPGTGTATVTFTATDSCGNSTDATATLKIVDTTPPTATGDQASTPEDSSVLIDVLGNDSDRCSSELTIVAVTTPTFGEAVLVGDAVEYTPPPDASGTAQFQYTVVDCAGKQATAVVRVSVTPVNDPPAAIDQSVTLNEDTSAALTLEGTDGDGDSLTYSIASDPSHGALLGFDPLTGAVTYVPDPEYNGPDSFRFLVCDPAGSCDTGTVTLTVRPVNDAPVAFDETEVLSENQSLPIQLSGDDPDGDALTYAILGGPANGALVGFDPASGSVTYVPNHDYNGPDSFTFSVCDPSGACSTATVALTVVEVDDRVTAVDQSVELDEDTSLFIQLVGTDVDGDMLPSTVLAGPQHGTLIDYDPTTGSVTYVPDPNYSGPDSFTFTACDESGVCDEGVVLITVRPLNDPPVAADQTDVLSEDESLPIQLAGTDPDGDTLTYALATGPTHGTLIDFDPTTGTVTYVPGPDYNGTDSFTFTVCDPDGACDTGTVTLAVTPVNDPPVAIGAAGTLNEGSSLPLQLEGTDVDGDVLTFSIAAGPSHGTSAGFDPATGAVTYVPNPNYNGPDSFTFTVCGPTGACDTATVTLTVSPVNDPPEASPQDVWTREDVSLPIRLSASDVDGDAVFYVIVAAPAHGTILGLDPSTGALMYVPEANYNGLDSFTFRACDPAGACDTAAVSVLVVPVNDPPAAADQALMLDEDQALPLELAGSDVDGDVLSFTILVPPEHGILVGFDPQSGTVTYVPDPNYDGADSFVFSVCDPAGACDTGTVSLVIRPVNEAPLARDDSLTVSDAGPNSIVLTGTDPDGDRLVYRIVSAPTHGTISGFDPVSGELTYTADPGYSGPDSFTFEVCDLSGACDEATIELLVTAVAHAPVSGPQTVSTSEDTPITILLEATDSNGDTLTFSIPGPPAHGRIESIDAATGQVVYVPDKDFDGIDQFVFQACDPSGACSAAIVTVIVLPVNEAPIATSFETTVTAGTAVDLQLIAQDPEGASLVFTIVSGPSHGTIASFDAATGAFTYVPAEGYAGPDVIVFRVCDPSGLCAEGVVQTLAVLVAGGGALAGCELRMIISEVAWSGTAFDAKHEWIELRNLEPEGIDLDGWTVRWHPISPTSSLDGFWRVIGLSGVVGAFSGSASVDVAALDGGWFRVGVGVNSSQDIVLLERATDEVVRDVEATQVYGDQLALGRTLDLPDAGAVVELVDPQGCVVDRVGRMPGRDEGWLAGNQVPPATMQRDGNLVEAATSEWSTNWGPFVSGRDAGGNVILGTPGAVNPPPLRDVLALLPPRSERRIPPGGVLSLALPGEPSQWVQAPAVVRLTDRIEGQLAVSAEGLEVEAGEVGGAVGLTVGLSNLLPGDYVLWVCSQSGEVYAVLFTITP